MTNSRELLKKYNILDAKRGYVLIIPPWNNE